MSEIVLGVGGSVAAYRAADLARELMRRGHGVSVLLTESAARFVTPLLFESLTGRPCLVGAYEEPERGRMAHIDLARTADLVLVAPVTASGLAKLAHGIADDMLTTVALATRAPLLLAPAMNPDMWAAETTRSAVATLLARGTELVEPVGGLVACGEEGTGKLADVLAIADAADTAARRAESLKGRRIVITTGPTEEPIDDVRFLTNRSSGKMGAALVRAALAMGATVHAIAGPQSAPLPPGATIVRVRTAMEMEAAALAACEGADFAIGVAAVADYRPEAAHAGKLRRSGDALDLRLVPNPDIVAGMARRAGRTLGFAAEPSPDLQEARAKLARKGLWGVAHNDVSDPEIGFGSERNQVTLITEAGEESIGIAPKAVVARTLLARLADLR